MTTPTAPSAATVYAHITARSSLSLVGEPLLDALSLKGRYIGLSKERAVEAVVNAGIRFAQMDSPEFTLTEGERAELLSRVTEFQATLV